MICIIVSVILLGASWVTRQPHENTIQFLRTYVTVTARAFDSACKSMVVSISKLNNHDSVSIESARKSLRACRVEYKKIAFFLGYFFPNQDRIFNSTPRVEIEEPSLEYEQPHGLQQIESLLFEIKNGIDKNQLIEQAKLVEESARNLPSLLYRFDCDEWQILKSATNELIRVKSLYLGGYDCKLSKNGLAESAAALAAVKKMLCSFTRKDSNAVRLTESFDFCITYLQRQIDSDEFNYSWFLAVPFSTLERKVDALLVGLGAGSCLKTPMVGSKKLSQNLTTSETAMISFGEKIFSDNCLSGNGEISCASCHRPTEYYAEPIASHERFDKKAFLERNTPSLNYSSYQTTEFWDGRAASLSEQIEEVLTSPTEMHSRIEDVLKKVNENLEYRQLLRKKASEKIELSEIEQALIAFLKSLSTFSSRFDLFINGSGDALTKDEQHGFNLFMGKAKCGTCHFIPLFNGEIPPDFRRTEYEILGTTADDDFVTPKRDTDSGRYRKYPSAFYIAAFKTPSLRNVTHTSPYMHNGNFKTLEKVLEFHNLGGGRGMGLDIPNQTLRGEPLVLTSKEIADIVAFLGTLSDERFE